MADAMIIEPFPYQPEVREWMMRHDITAIEAGPIPGVSVDEGILWRLKRGEEAVNVEMDIVAYEHTNPAQQWEVLTGYWQKGVDYLNGGGVE